MISTELLRRYPYFTAGGEYALQAITMFAEQTQLEADDILISEDDPANKLFVIIEGAIEVEAKLGDGSSEVVDTLVAGDLLGWSAMFAGRRYSATCVAQGDAKLLVLDADKLRALCTENTRLGLNLMSEVVKAVGHRLGGVRVKLAACHQNCPGD